MAAPQLMAQIKAVYDAGLDGVDLLESEQHLQADQLQRALRGVLCLGVSVAIGTTVLAADTCSMAFHAAPGQVVAYDGTYVLQTAGSNNAKSLVLASVAYGLVLRVEASDAQASIIVIQYDRFTGSGSFARTGSSPVGRSYRYRITAAGRVEDLSNEERPHAWGDPFATWSGWPSGPIQVGAHWHGEGVMKVEGGGQIKMARDYSLCELDGRGDPPLAFLDYVEQGVVTSVPVNLPDGPAFLDGSILGVGQVRFNLNLGLPNSSASVSTLTGRLRRDGNNSVSAGIVRLETEAKMTVRRPLDGAG